ncbi:MAG: CBS domain-containing protein [Halobacteriales archaeon]|nr:CBS domain-containing protein [Halobacteriales archaeon]
MNGTVSIRDVMAREYVGVSESDAVAGAARLMRDEGVESAVVLRGSEPIGVLGAREVMVLVADGHDPMDTPVEAVMTNPPVLLTADADITEAIAEISRRDVRRIVVTEDSEVVGVVTEHDIITATSAMPEIEVGPGTTTTGAETVGETEPGPEGTAVAGMEAEEVDQFSSQSVCEACGSLSANLNEVNGQLVCADCREV